MAYLLGIDVGSSGAKVALLAPDGTVAALAAHGYPTEEPQPQYKEQDPEQWWRAAVAGIREVLAAAPSGEVVAVGAAGHISSLTFVDSAGRPLRPAMGFQDLRAVAEVAEIARLFSRQDLAERLGIDLPPAATWPLPRLLWFLKHEPSTLERAHCVLQAKDYVNFRLTGALASDLASNRGMVSQTTGLVPRDVFARLGLPDSLTPPTYACTEIIGRVTASAARETGLPAGTPVAAGCNDLNACMLGSGSVESGRAFNITGTSEHIGVVTEKCHSVPALISAPYLPGLNLFYGVTSSGGGSLDWFLRAFDYELEDLLRAAEAAPAGSGGLTFLPYLEGERAPIWDASASGAFIGIRAHHRGHFARALLEGVAFSLRHNLETVERHAGMAAGPLVISGGGARIRLWNRIKAGVLERTVAVPRNPQVGVAGAAMLAAAAVGLHSSCAEAARAMVQPQDSVEPAREDIPQYRESYERYRQLYPALKRWFAGHGRNSASGR
jgi:xylulokinase